jgi:hypothetical protein
VNPFEAPDSPANSESLDRQNALGAPQPPEIPNPDLVTIVRELDKHVGADGWDQAPRLFALVPTADLIAREPSIAATLGIDESAAPLTPIEQEPLPGDRPLDDALAGIAWPTEVVGAALTVERIILPPDAEAALPGYDEGADVAAAAAAHPAAQDVRLTVAVLRDGTRATGLRVRSYPEGQDLIIAAVIAPSLTDALTETLTENTG